MSPLNRPIKRAKTTRWRFATCSDKNHRGSRRSVAGATGRSPDRPITVLRSKRQTTPQWVSSMFAGATTSTRPTSFDFPSAQSQLALRKYEGQPLGSGYSRQPKHLRPLHKCADVPKNRRGRLSPSHRPPGSLEILNFLALPDMHRRAYYSLAAPILFAICWLASCSQCASWYSDASHALPYKRGPK